MVIAIFDFDGTLYLKDSIIEFTKYIYRRHPLRVRFVFFQVIGLILHQLNLINTKQFKNIYFIFLKGIKPEILSVLLKEFWNQQYPICFRPELVNKVRELNEQCIYTICISASPKFFIEDACNRIGLKKIIATQLNYSNSYIIDGENCRGAEKIKRLAEQFNLTECSIKYAVSDNFDDIPLLKMAENALFIKQDKEIVIK